MNGWGPTSLCLERVRAGRVEKRPKKIHCDGRTSTENAFFIIHVPGPGYGGRQSALHTLTVGRHFAGAIIHLWFANLPPGLKTSSPGYHIRRFLCYVHLRTAHFQPPCVRKCGTFCAGFCTEGVTRKSLNPRNLAAVCYRETCVPVCVYVCVLRGGLKLS